MNIVLLVNSYNVEDIRSFLTAAAELQEEKAPGAILIVYQATLGADLINGMAGDFIAKMSAGGIMPVPINEMMGNHGRTAALFCYFISNGYARFPGPWLIVDGPGIPVEKDFMHLLERQHGGLGGMCSGRFSVEGVAEVPIGPVVIGVPVNTLTWYNGGYESWRVTMRFMLYQHDFKTVPLNEYLFSLPSAVASPAPVAPPAEPPASPSAPIPPVFDPSCLDQPVASPQAVDPQADGEPRKDPLPEDTVCPGTDTPEPEQDGDRAAGPYDHLEREALFDLIAERSHLDRPHHSTGKTKLIALLVEDDAAPTDS